MSNYRLTNDGQQETLDSEDETLRWGNHRASGGHSNEWLVNVADDVVVPMVTSEVVLALRARRLTNRSLVWRMGMHDWTPLAEVPQLRLAAGPSALVPAASTPWPMTVKKPPKPTAEQRRRNTLPMGFPAVRGPAGMQQPGGPTAAVSTPVSKPIKPSREDSSAALAVYDRPAASLTFADSVRAEWQGEGRIVNQSAASPAPKAPGSNAVARRLTPLPSVPARLPVRVTQAAPSNTLAPTTAEPQFLASTRGRGMWSDRSVVLASELRAFKKSSKHVALWAAVGSALVASAFTFWAAHAPVRGLAQTPVSTPAVVDAAAAAHEAARKNLAPMPDTVLPAPSVVASALPVANAPTIPKVAQVRAVKRAKPSAPPLTEVAAPASTEFNPYADDSPSEPRSSESKPSAPTPSQLEAAMATAAQAPSAAATLAQPATPSPPASSDLSPGL